MYAAQPNLSPGLVSCVAPEINRWFEKKIITGVSYYGGVCYVGILKEVEEVRHSLTELPQGYTDAKLLRQVYPLLDRVGDKTELREDEQKSAPDEKLGFA